MHNGMPATQFNNLVARGSAHCQSTEIYPQILRKSLFFVGAAAFLSSHGMAGEKHALVFGV
jgi:hypothetical protein